MNIDLDVNNSVPLEDLSVVIQAGGESRRMGKPKATVPFLGRPLICRSVHRLAPLSTEMIVTTNDPDSLLFLNDATSDAQACHLRRTIRFERDVCNERGSLKGLLTALTTATRPYIALTACDMIFPSAPVYLYEYQLLKKGDCDIAMPVTFYGQEPFHGVYRRETCLEYVKHAIAVGEKKITACFATAKIEELTRDDILTIDPRGGSFLNVNTPEELHAVEQRIMADEMTFVEDSSIRGNRESRGETTDMKDYA